MSEDQKQPASPDSAKPEAVAGKPILASSNVLALRAIILQLEMLRSEKEWYQEQVGDERPFVLYPDHRSDRKGWWRRVEEQINQIEPEIDKIRECIRSQWPYSGSGGPAFNDITPILKSKSPDRMNGLIQGFKLTQQRLEAEAAKPKPPTPTPPAEPQDEGSGEASGQTDEMKEAKDDAGRKYKNEVPWDDADQSYVSNTDAIVTFTKSRMALPELSKLLRSEDSPIHFMRRGQRTKVHIGEFRDYAQKHYVPDALAEEVADEVLADREARREEEDRRKTKTGK